MIIMADIGDLADRLKVGDPVYDDDVEIGWVQKIDRTTVYVEIGDAIYAVWSIFQPVGQRHCGMIHKVAGSPAFMVEAVPDERKK